MAVVVPANLTSWGWRRHTLSYTLVKHLFVLVDTVAGRNKIICENNYVLTLDKAAAITIFSFHFLK